MPAMPMTSRLLIGVRERVSSALRLQLRDLPPGRRLRLRLAIDAIDAFARARPDGERLRVLDAGSEEGLLCHELARRHPAWTFVAADIAIDPLRRGREWARDDNLQVGYVQLDLTRWLGEDLYDVVASLECLVEVPDDEAALRAMVTSLRPGGLFVAHLPTKDWTPVLATAERTWRREARHGYDADELHTRITDMGLQVMSLRPTFRRGVALAQDLRDRLRPRRRAGRLALLPAMAAAVQLERSGVAWGPPRGLFVLAVKTLPQ